jgi:hypothetical protein
MVRPVVKTLVQFRGSRVPDQEVKSRDVAALTIPAGVVGFVFYDIVTMPYEHRGTPLELKSEPANLSPIYLIGMTVLKKGDLLAKLSAQVGDVAEDADDDEQDRHAELIGQLQTIEDDKQTKAYLVQLCHTGTHIQSVFGAYDPAKHVLVSLTASVVEPS